MSTIGSPKLGGSALIIGSVVALVGIILHTPFSLSSPETITLLLSTDAYSRLINENIGLWYLSHILLALSPPIMILGFLNLYGVLAGKDERTYSLTAILSLSLGMVLVLWGAITDGFVKPILAQKFLAASAEAKESAAMIFQYDDLLFLSILFAGFLATRSGLGLLGVSLIKTKLYNKWFAWAGVIIGLFAVFAIIVDIFVSIGISVFFIPIYSLWFLVLGIFLYRG